MAEPLPALRDALLAAGASPEKTAAAVAEVAAYCGPHSPRRQALLTAASGLASGLAFIAAMVWLLRGGG